jgi:AcrR family transcriptional regulator
MGRPRKITDFNGESPEVDQETRQRIIKAAEELFVSKGYKGVSMKEVALAAKVTAAALYYYFPAGKEDLFLDVIKTMFEEWAAGVTHAVAGGQDVRERLKLLTIYFMNNPHGSFPMLMRDVTHYIEDEDKKREMWKNYIMSYQQAVSQIFQQAIEDGEVGQSIPANLITMLYQGMTISVLNNPRMVSWRTDPLEAERLSQIIVSVLLDGIGVRESVPKNEQSILPGC